nr:immunoglobulin light chain junction region [Macaca mulatta]MOW31601.1 immunoglobulin light chain junction region [Macaca mulatta]
DYYCQSYANSRWVF